VVGVRPQPNRRVDQKPELIAVRSTNAYSTLASSLFKSRAPASAELLIPVQNEEYAGMRGPCCPPQARAAAPRRFIATGKCPVSNAVGPLFKNSNATTATECREPTGIIGQACNAAAAREGAGVVRMISAHPAPWCCYSIRHNITQMEPSTRAYRHNRYGRPRAYVVRDAAGTSPRPSRRQENDGMRLRCCFTKQVVQENGRFVRYVWPRAFRWGVQLAVAQRSTRGR